MAVRGASAPRESPCRRVVFAAGGGGDACWQVLSGQEDVLVPAAVGLLEMGGVAKHQDVLISGCRCVEHRGRWAAFSFLSFTS